MNTPKSKEPTRYRGTQIGKSFKAGTEGTWITGIVNPDIAKRFTDVVTHFVFLEEDMAALLAFLLGADDPAPSSYVFRAIRSPKTRVDVMKALLEDAPHNRSRESDCDDMLTEFSAISKQRNGYVHGVWWTGKVTGSAYVSEFLNELSLLSSREVPPSEFDALLKRIHDLRKKLSRLRVRLAKQSFERRKLATG